MAGDKPIAMRRRYRTKADLATDPVYFCQASRGRGRVCGRELDLAEEVGRFARCEPCREATRRRYILRKSQPGACNRCGSDKSADPLASHADLGASYCATCWIADRARHWFGRRAREHVAALRDRFLIQGGQCALTGERLIIGRNTSLDHMVPRSRGGGNEIGNAWFTLASENAYKRDRTPEQLYVGNKAVVAWMESPEYAAIATRLHLHAQDHARPTPGR